MNEWLQTQVGLSERAMLANISPAGAARGAVTASPSTNPNYRFHWIRDAALVLDVVSGLRDRASDAKERAALLAVLKDYAEFSRRNQLTHNPSGAALGLGLGEPKFHLDGSAFTEDWGRPQNDGPALRAVTLIRVARALIAEGQEAWVREKLYSETLPPSGSIIKADLEFVSHHWRDSSFDLWEEMRGHHFYTRMVQRRSLIEGAALAESFGDSKAAGWYREQARALGAAIETHWRPERGIVVATLGRDGGHQERASGLDVAVVLGVLHGAVPGDSFFSVTDGRILATAERLRAAFDGIYGISRRRTDDAGRPLGTPIGRYPEDQYDGYGLSEGNPWFLATNAYAELHFRLARELAAAGTVRVTKESAAFFRSLPGIADVNEGDVWSSAQRRFTRLLDALAERGDAYLRRGRFHMGPGGACSEQFNRHTGFMQGAEELTWSHASLLTAAWQRQ